QERLLRSGATSVDCLGQRLRALILFSRRLDCPATSGAFEDRRLGGPTSANLWRLAGHLCDAIPCEFTQALKALLDGERRQFLAVLGKDHIHDVPVLPEHLVLVLGVELLDVGVPVGHPLLFLVLSRQILLEPRGLRLDQLLLLPANARQDHVLVLLRVFDLEVRVWNRRSLIRSLVILRPCSELSLQAGQALPELLCLSPPRPVPAVDLPGERFCKVFRSLEGAA